MGVGLFIIVAFFKIGFEAQAGLWLQRQDSPVSASPAWTVIESSTAPAPPHGCHFFFKMLFKSGGSPQQCLHLVLERWENRKFYTLAWLSTGLKSVCQASWKSSLYVDVYIIVAACQQWPWLCKGFILANTGLWLYQYLHRDWQGVPVLKSCWPLPAPA